MFSVEKTHGLPGRYQVIKVLGEGGFGKVLKCRDKHTKEIVAIKIPKFQHRSDEVSILKLLMRQKFDTCNIVKVHSCFEMVNGDALVFENLDMSIQDYLNHNFRPMLLSDIRIIINQLAIALAALKSVGIIHTDIKLDNVMLVNQERPFNVKLIDFGLAIYRREAYKRKRVQTIGFRAPEIILGLPYSEAIDMWSLGSFLFTMLACALMSRATNELEAMNVIVDLLGMPPDDLLNKGVKTRHFFTRTESGTWKMEESLNPDILCPKDKFFLDDLKAFRQECGLKDDDEELEQCYGLMKAMLAIRESDRITPLAVLNHPFITGDYKDQKQNKCQPSKRTPNMSEAETRTSTSTSTSTPQELQGPAFRARRPLVIQVRPAAPKNTQQLEDDSDSYYSYDDSDSLQASPGRTLITPETAVKTDCKEKQQQPKKKKKNICRRFISWVRRNFCCNRVGVM